MSPSQFLFERIHVHDVTSSTSVESTTGCQLQLSPNGSALAIIEPGQQAVSITQLEGSSDTPHGCSAPYRFTSTVMGSPAGKKRPQPSVQEVFTAVAWSAGSHQLLAVGLSGSLYLMSASKCTPDKVWLSSLYKTPWVGSNRYVVGAALPSTGKALLVTSDGAVFRLALDASMGEKQWEQQAKPIINLKGTHAGVRAAGYCHDAHLLVIAGPGGSKPGSTTPGACVSMWKWADGEGKLRAWKSYGSPQGAGPEPTGCHGLHMPWVVAFSPNMIRLVVAGPACRPAVFSVDEGTPVESSVRKSESAGPGLADPVMQGVCSACWWDDHRLAVTNLSGLLALTHPPHVINLLGLPGAAPEQCVPGALVSVKANGGSSGLLLVEPTDALELALRRTSSDIRSPSLGGALKQQGGWRISLLAQRTPDQLLRILLAQQDWAAASKLCEAYNLGSDEVHKAAWLSQPISTQTISSSLAKVSDLSWSCQQVLQGRCAADADTQRALIDWALDTTAAGAAAADNMGYGAEATYGPSWWRRMRLQLLQHKDRLDMLLAVQQGLYEPEAFAELRDASLIDVAQAWAGLGDVRALSCLLVAAPCILGPHLLTLLNSLPETLDPRSYSHLLPKADDTAPTFSLPKTNAGTPNSDAAVGLAALQSVRMREADWVESAMTANELMQEGHNELFTATDVMAAITNGLAVHTAPVLPSEEVEAWYCSRAVHLDVSSGQLAGAAALLELATTIGGCNPTEGPVARLAKHAKVLQATLPMLGEYPSGGVGDGQQRPAWLMTLAAFAGMRPGEQLRLVMHTSTEGTLKQDITDRVAPFLLAQPSSAAPQLLSELIASELCTRPAWCAALVELEANHPRLLPNTPQLASAVMNGIAHSKAVSAWEDMQKMLTLLLSRVEEERAEQEAAGHADRAHKLSQLSSSASLLISQVAAGQLLNKYHLQLTMPELNTLSKSDSGAHQQLVTRLLTYAERSGSSWSNKQWSALWTDLRALQSGTDTDSPGLLRTLSRPHLQQQYVSLLLRLGKVDLAKPYLTGSQGLAAGAADELLVSSARDLLAAASALDDPEVLQAQELLALAPPDSKAAREERALLSALQLLADVGVQLLPAQLQQWRAQQAKQPQRDQQPQQLQTLQYLLKAGGSQHVVRQLDTVQQLMSLLGLDTEPHLLAQAKLCVVQCASESNDWEAVTGLLVSLIDDDTEGLSAEQLPTAAGLAMQVMSSRAGQALEAHLQAALLRFAAAHAPAQQLPGILDALLSVDLSCAGAGVHELLSAPPEYHLRRALSLPHQPLPLPSLGDMPLSLALLSAAPNTAQAEQLVRGLINQGPDGSGSPGTDEDEDFGTLQRALLAGIHALALRALQQGCPGGPAGLPVGQVQEWLQLPAHDLLAKAEASGVQGTEAAAALQAASTFAQLLRAAADGRAVRSVVPDAKPSQFLGKGDPAQRAQALLQQALVAGEQAAGLLPGEGSAPASRGSSNGQAGSNSAAAVSAGLQLLRHAMQLASQYDVVPEWQLRAQFMTAALRSAKTVSPELKQAIQSEAQQILQTPNLPYTAGLLLMSVLAHLVWPSVPTSSSSHMSLIVSIISLCLPGMSPAPPANTQQRLSKLCDLLDKAGGALRGLALQPILTPLLRSSLGPQQLPALPADLLATNGLSAGGHTVLVWQGGDSSATDSELGSLSVGAQGAVYTYSSQASVGAASKLLKALQAIFATSTSQDGSNTDATIINNLGKVLSALPVSLPHLCLLCKSSTTSSSSGAASSASAHTTLDAATWSSLRDSCLEKLSAGQLRAWLDFMLLGGKQPLSPNACGRITPLRLRPDIRLAVAADGLKQLPELSAAAAAAQGSKPLPEVTSRLLQLYTRLKVWDALMKCSLPKQVHHHLFEACEASCQPGPGGKALPGHPSAYELLTQLTSAQLSVGISLHDMTVTLATAWPEPGLLTYAAPAGGYQPGLETAQLLQSQFTEKLEAALQAVVTASSGATITTSAQEVDQQSTQAIHALRMLIQSLQHGDRGTHTSSGSEQPSHQQLDKANEDDNTTGVAELRANLTQQLVQAVSSVVDSLAAEQYAHPAVASLLALHMELLTNQALPGAAPHTAAATAADPTRTQPPGQQAIATGVLSARLLLASTMSALLSGGAWSLPLPLDLPDLQSLEAAEAAFIRLAQVASQPAQLDSLHQVLQSVWLDGAALGAHPTHDSALVESDAPHTDIHTEGHAAAVGEKEEGAGEGDQGAAQEGLGGGAAEQQASMPGEQEQQQEQLQEGQVPGTAPGDSSSQQAADKGKTCTVLVSPLHACWRELIAAAARMGHFELCLRVVADWSKRLVDQPCLLSSTDSNSLVSELTDLGSETNSSPAALAGLLALSVPYPQVHDSFFMLLSQHGPQLLLACHSTSLAHALAARMLASELLLHPAEGTSTTQSDHAAMVQQALIAFVQQESHAEGARLLLPCTVAQLCMGGQFSTAAALAAHACHWTTALRALGGSLAFLDHFLATASRGLSTPQQGHVDNDNQAQAAFTHHLLGTSATGWLSKALVAVRSSCDARH